MISDYQRLADEAIRIAQQTTDQRARAAIEEIAYTWARLARAAQSTRPMPGMRKNDAAVN